MGMTTGTTRSLATSGAGALQYRQRMDDPLREAIEQTDLPALVERYYPDSGAHPGRKETVCAVWRGDEHESFSLFRGPGGTWLYRDHRTGETGNAFGFLTDICGLSKAEAAKQLKVGEENRAVPAAPVPVKRSRRAKIEAGDAVHDALQHAVNERRITGFKHPLSRATLSQENALICVQGALETPHTGDNQRILEAAHEALRELARRRKRGRREGKPVAYYDYVDEQGELLFQVVRYEPKSFSQRRPHGNRWAWGLSEGHYLRGRTGNFYLEDDDTPADGERIYLKACSLVLYDLPRVEQAVRDGFVVHLVEGEEDVRALGALGLVATCNPGGALKWEDGYTETLRGAKVVILPDNDEAGELHARQVCEALSGVAQRVRIVRLPGLPPAGDVRDWLKTHDRRQLIVELAQLDPRR